MLSRLHEREPESRAIVDALDEVVAGRGQVVVVEGPAGIGKTSLLEFAGEAARARNLAVASARGSDLELAYAWGVTRQLFEPRLRGLLDLARAEHGLGRPEALDRVLAASEVAVDDVERAHAALALMWASGPGRQDPKQALAMIERAIDGVAGRDQELELRLEAVRFMAIFMSDALMQQALGEPERFADLEGRTAGECELLLHVAIHRLLGGRTAPDVAAPLERAVADPELVAAIGPDSAWLQFVIGGLYKTDRLDLARRTVAIAFAEAQRRGSAPGFAAASVWRAWIALRAGSAADAEADARAAHELLPAAMWQRGRTVSCLIDVLIERGELEEAQAVLDASGGADAVASDGGAAWMLATLGCGTGSSTWSARPRAVSSPGRWSSWAPRCAGAAAQCSPRAAPPRARPRVGGRSDRDRGTGAAGAAGDGSQDPPARILGHQLADAE